jgi:hypothetical protein
MNAFNRRGFLGALTAGSAAAKGLAGRLWGQAGGSSAAHQVKPAYRVQSPNLTVELSREGEIMGLVLGKKGIVWPVQGRTSLAGCRVEGAVQVDERKDGGVRFTKTLVGELNGARKEVTLYESFFPTKDSVRWEMRLDGHGAPWSTAVETHLEFSRPKDKKFWTTWGDPEPDKPSMKTEGWPGVLFGAWKLLDIKEGPSWSDPLVLKDFRDRSFWYGAVTYDYSQTTNFYIPFFGDVFCIPVATVVEEENDVGVSLALSLDDVMLDMTMQTTAAGGVKFSRLFRRISESSPVDFSMDLTAHEPDWRGGLRWMTERYPEYFHPPLASAGELGGTGAYSSYEGELDAEKLKRMAFTVNWKASFDYPYQGMWMPPVPDGEKWTRLKPWTDDPKFYIGHSTSVPQMAEYSRKMRKAGLYVLNYYDFAEFGTHMIYPAPPFRRSPSDPDFWQDPNDFLYANFADAIVLHSEKVSPRIQLQATDDGTPGPVQVGWPWADFILDWGEPSWQNFLLDQAKKLIQKIPDSSGMCIDRLDFLRLYNFRRDDGVTWYDGAPARSLVVSWKDFSEKLGAVQHNAGQTLFVNNHIKRIDILKQVDGLFDEHGDYGPSKNLTAMVGMFKPTIEWVQEASKFKPDPDTFMQRFMHLGMFPVAPFPQNDHCILPSAEADKIYLDYGPMFTAMRGRKWSLLPHVIQIDQGEAKANLFKVPSGYVLAITLGGSAANSSMTLRDLPEIVAGKTVKCEFIHPGETEWKECALRQKQSVLSLKVPLSRGCAMVRLMV